MIIAIDQSKWSTGVVCLDMQGNLVDFMLINPYKESEDLNVLWYQWVKLDEFIRKHKEGLKGIVFEGLSYGSISSSKDFLAGLFWVLRFNIWNKYPDIPIGTLPNSVWFSATVTKDERKTIAGDKNGRKKIVVDKLPYDVKVRFEGYVREVGAKKEALYDLADGYHLAKFRLTLED